MIELTKMGSYTSDKKVKSGQLEYLHIYCMDFAFL